MTKHDLKSNDLSSDTHYVKSEDLNKILEVARALATSRDLNDILQLIIRSACTVMQADRASVFLNDEATNELFIRVAMGEKMDEIRFPNNLGIAGHVFTTGLTVNIVDAYQDSRFNKEVDIKTGYHTKTILTMPLDTGEKIVGVIQVINKDQDGIFDQYDEAVMSALASQAAVSIHNFWLNQEYLKKEQMQASLHVARSIQKSFLPDHAPEISGLSISAYSESCDETGGDYYDYYKIDDDHVIVVIGDVTGHGVGSAMLMATSRSALHALWAKENDPQKLLEQLNNILERDMGDDRFITIFLGVVDMRRKTLTYASAGHDAPILYRADSDECIELDSTGIPLGMMEEMEYPIKTVYMKPGDIVYMMTDGIWEAMNARHETYGRDRLFDFIKSHQEVDDSTCLELIRSVTDFCAGEPPHDDMTLVVLNLKKQSGPLRIHREAQLMNFPKIIYEDTFESTMDEKNRVLEVLMNKVEKEEYVLEEHLVVVRLCFDEALVNAIDHGNEYDLNKKVHVCLSCNDDYWSLIINDEGVGFLDHEVPDPDAQISLELEHGRGVLIMTEFMDAVWYNDWGNSIQMIRRLPVQEEGS